VRERGSLRRMAGVDDVACRGRWDEINKFRHKNGEKQEPEGRFPTMLFFTSVERYYPTPLASISNF
jgi:hypothetical protein